jgi:glucose/arabinose dehydrogenase
MKKPIIVLMLVLAPLAVGVLLQSQPLAQQATSVVESRPPNGAGQTPAFSGQTRAPQQKLNVSFDVVTVAAAVEQPWGLAFLPGGKMLVTERVGRLRIVDAAGQLSEPVAGLPMVDNRGQGGLLDVTLDPNFATNQLIYWSFSEPKEGGANNTAVARGKLVDGAAPRVENVQVIYHQEPSLRSTLHYGSRLVFGRDGTLFVTQGERSITEGRMQAQKMDSLIGKIVRINADGSIPKDNPFVGKAGIRPEIWSSGHRNVQGAALHPATGELWTIEHGTRGGDELNVPKKGGDYGWPTIAYGIEYQGGPILGGIQAKEGMEQPRYYWDPVIAPGGMSFYNGSLFPAWKGSLFIGGLGGQHVARLTISGDKVTGEERLLEDMDPRARIRLVKEGPDGAMYILAEGRGGRGVPPTPGRILKLVPKR